VGVLQAHLLCFCLFLDGDILLFRFNV